MNLILLSRMWLSDIIMKLNSHLWERMLDIFWSFKLNNAARMESGGFS